MLNVDGSGQQRRYSVADVGVGVGVGVGAAYLCIKSSICNALSVFQKVTLIEKHFWSSQSMQLHQSIRK